MKSFSFSRLLLLTAVLGGLTRAAVACSICGCSLCSDWADQGYPSSPGLEFGLRFEYSDQRQLRSGSDTVDRASLSLPQDEEIQQRTLNRSTWLDLAYAAGA
ncbi:MAG: hypothetical protein ABUL61_05130, partial [Oleiharenicola lentus]